MKKQRNKSDKYNEKLNEWLENQYNPGYYTGGKMPPIVANIGNQKLFGWFKVISSIIGLLFITLLFIKMFEMVFIIEIILLAIYLYGLIILELISGIKLIKKGTSEKAYNKLKKKLITYASIILITIILLVSINNIFLVKESVIIINNMKEVNLVKINEGTDNIILNDGKLILESNNFNSFKLWIEKDLHGNKSFKIYYKWNILNPNHKKVKDIKLIN